MSKLGGGGITAHTRGESLDAGKAMPKGKKSLKSQYADAKKARQTQPKPALRKFKSILGKVIITVTPKSKLGIPIAYRLKH
jgi:hypothetical protein